MVHIKRIKAIAPETGMVSILSVTDKQYGDIVNYWGKEKKEKNADGAFTVRIFLVHLQKEIHIKCHFLGNSRAYKCLLYRIIINLCCGLM